MSDFDKALKIVLEFEGGYVNDPADPGGATNYGVTQAAYDAFRKAMRLPMKSVKEIVMGEVGDIYEAYWINAACDKLPPGLDVFHFDTAVNCGVGTAGKLLQKSINSSRSKTGTQRLKADGIVGPITIKAIVEVDLSILLWWYSSHRKDYYVSLLPENKGLEKFYGGWISRVEQIYKIVREGK